MTFKPFIVGTGLSAWSTLQSTLARQKDTFNKRPDISNQIKIFESEMQEINNPETLVNKWTSLNVALGAFDLSEDVNNGFFIQRILEEGSTETSALANRLQDNRYRQLAQNFSSENFLFQNTKDESFINDISQRYMNISFEKAVGNLNSDLRLALGFKRTLPSVASASTTDAAWFQVMANPPVKEVFQKVFGLPVQFGLLDIDRQHEIMKEKSDIYLGTSDLSILSQDDKIESTIRTFLLKQQINEINVNSPMQIALSLISRL
jgi:hypothetical protein